MTINTKRELVDFLATFPDGMLVRLCDPNFGGAFDDFGIEIEENNGVILIQFPCVDAVD
jgi:hypothetical protein